MDTTVYTPVTGSIQTSNAVRGDCCSRTATLRTANGLVRFTISPDTYVVDNVRLRPGQRVTAFYDSSQPVPLIYPPQYRAALIAATRAGEQAAFGFFNQNLVMADNSLRLNLSSSTEIVTTNGQPFQCNPGGRLLAVFYSTTTRSIPPQATPRRVIVFC